MIVQRLIGVLALAFAFIGSGWHLGVARGDTGCEAAAESGSSYVGVGMTCTTSQEALSNPASSTEGTGATAVFSEYQWLSVCAEPGQASTISYEVECQAAMSCAEPDQRLYRLWGRDVTTGAWTALSAQCFGETPEAPNVPRPRVTPALVLREIQRIGLPTLQAMTQPEGKTLVNFDTIFYTEAEPFTATVTLLGRPVDIVAEPTSYTWHHGDGTTTTTSTPGAPYPSREITYRYADARTTVRPSVDVTYSARFRVNGGAWQGIGETVTITGPEGSLRISEARGSLSGNYG